MEQSERLRENSQCQVQPSPMIEHSQLDIALRHLLRLKPLEGVEGEERLEVTVFAVDDWRHHIGPVNHIDFRQDALTMHQSNIFQVHFVPEGGLE